MDRGIEKAREEGRQEGRREGEISLVTRQLAMKVGPLEDDLVVRLNDLSEAALVALGEALLGFSGRADLDDWLAQVSS